MNDLLLLSKSPLIQLYGMTTSPISLKKRKSASYPVYHLEEEKCEKEISWCSQDEGDRKLTFIRKFSKAFDVLAMST